MLETLNVGAWADHVTVTIVIVTVVYGIRVGAYESTALGLRWLGAVFGGVALALHELPGRELETLDVPPEVARALGLVLCVTILFVGSTVALRRIEAWQDVPVPRLPRPIDALLGGSAGCMTGLVVAGLLQVIWMMPVIPNAMRIDERALDKRCGERLLSTFADFTGVDRDMIHARVVGKPAQ